MVKPTLQEVADNAELSIATVKTNAAKLQDKGLLIRQGAKKNGSWKVCIN